MRKDMATITFHINGRDDPLRSQANAPFPDKNKSGWWEGQPADVNHPDPTATSLKRRNTYFPERTSERLSTLVAFSCAYTS